MSIKGIFTALSGAKAQESRLDTIANNMANVSTPGFKKDGQVFREYLTANEKFMDVIQVPRIPASIESFYAMQGGDKGYVDSSETFTDYSQGATRKTGNPADTLIEGKGFFQVLTPDGVRMTRSGNFKVSGEGLLVNKEGHPILSAGVGGSPTSRTIQLGASSKLTISHDGEVYSDGDSVGVLSVVEVTPKAALKKIGSSLFALKENLNPQVSEASEYKIHQGFLEESNVNIVKEMTDMIAATRIFEAIQKTIQGHDKMNEKLVNEVPRTG